MVFYVGKCFKKMSLYSENERKKELMRQGVIINTQSTPLQLISYKSY